jgi:DNA-binding GntR family transcriptional regulator
MGEMAKKSALTSKDVLSLSVASPSRPSGRVGKPAGPGVATLSPVVRDTLQAQAYNKLREALMVGLIMPGHNLTLRATAEVMGTSPMPVRDAVRRLEIEHALVARSNRTLGVPEMTYASLMELREVRVALEGLAAEKAALLITPEELAEVDDRLQEMTAAASAGDTGAYLRANWAFHSAIYRAARSHLLLSMIEPTWMRIGPYVRLMLPDRDSLIESLGNHLRALEALRRRDQTAARQAIGQDICDSAEGLANMLRIREDQKSDEDGAKEERSPSRPSSKRPRSPR